MLWPQCGVTCLRTEMMRMVSFDVKLTLVRLSGGHAPQRCLAAAIGWLK